MGAQSFKDVDARLKAGHWGNFASDFSESAQVTEITRLSAKNSGGNSGLTAENSARISDKTATISGVIRDIYATISDGEAEPFALARPHKEVHLSGVSFAAKRAD